MTNAPANPQQIRQMLDGFKVSQMIIVAVELGIPDLLGDGTQGVDDLASATGAHAPTLYRLLRALAAVGVLDEQPGRAFALTRMSQQLRTDVPGSVAGYTRLQGRDYFWDAWGHLLHSVRTGENAFGAIHKEDVWKYRGDRPEENAIFNTAMVSLTNASTQALLAAYDFGPFGTIVDIGGGTGALLAAILQKHTKVRGVVFDQPHVIAAAPPVLDEAGVADRCTAVAGNMFESVPKGADAYTIKLILHDWDDADCVRILKTTHAALTPGAKLLVIERIVGPPNEDPVAKMADLNMLVLPGGRERTEDEWRTLLAAGDFLLARVVPTASGLCVIEGVPV